MKTVVNQKLVSVYKHPGAMLNLYELLIERSTEFDPYVNISHRNLPSMRAHKRFVESKPYHRWYLILVEQSDTTGGISLRGHHIVGTIYISKRNEIGIVLFRAYRGKRYGTKALAKLLDTHKPLKAIPGIRSGRFIANINPRNDKSIRMFKGQGFTHLSNTYQL